MWRATRKISLFLMSLPHKHLHGFRWLFCAVPASLSCPVVSRMRDGITTSPVSTLLPSHTGSLDRFYFNSELNLANDRTFIVLLEKQIITSCSGQLFPSLNVLVIWKTKWSFFSILPSHEALLQLLTQSLTIKTQTNHANLKRHTPFLPISQRETLFNASLQEWLHT